MEIETWLVKSAGSTVYLYVFIWLNHMTTCLWQVAQCNEPTKKYYPTAPFRSLTKSFLAGFYM